MARRSPVANGWLEMHDSQTYYRFTPAGKDLLGT